MNTEMPKIRPEIDMEALRNRIRSTLSEQRMTVQNLSEKTGIPKSTLDGFLNRGTTPAFDTGALVCAVLSIPSRAPPPPPSCRRRMLRIQSFCPTSKTAICAKSAL